MEIYEVRALLENLHLKIKDSWEMTRMISYVVAQTQSTKHLSPTDIISFPWENDNNVNIDTQEDLDAMMREMRDIENKLNNNG